MATRIGLLGIVNPGLFLKSKEDSLLTLMSAHEMLCLRYLIARLKDLALVCGGGGVGAGMCGCECWYVGG